MITIGQNVEILSRGSAPRMDVLGVLLEWKVAAAESGGAYCLLEAIVPPGVGVPLHQHPEQETFYVLDGEASFAREEEGLVRWIRAEPGDTVRIPSDALHGFRNAGTSPVRMLIAAEGKLERFFREAGVPAGDTPAPGPPPPEEIARVMAIAEKYGQRFAPPSA